MFGLGMGEIIVILIVALLVLGPDKLPEAAKTIGRTIRDLRKHTDSLRDTIENDEQLGGTVRELRSALRGDPLAPIKPYVRPPVPLEEEAPPSEAAKPAASAEGKPAETKSGEAQPAEMAAAAEQKPVEAKPADARPADPHATPPAAADRPHPEGTVAQGDAEPRPHG